MSIRAILQCRTANLHSPSGPSLYEPQPPPTTDTSLGESARPHMGERRVSAGPSPVHHGTAKTTRIARTRWLVSANLALRLGPKWAVLGSNQCPPACRSGLRCQRTPIDASDRSIKLLLIDGCRATPALKLTVRLTRVSSQAERLAQHVTADIPWERVPALGSRALTPTNASVSEPLSILPSDEPPRMPPRSGSRPQTTAHAGLRYIRRTRLHDQVGCTPRGRRFDPSPLIMVSSQRRRPWPA